MTISGIDITSSHLPMSVVFAVPDQDPPKTSCWRSGFISVFRQVNL